MPGRRSVISTRVSLAVLALVGSLILVSVPASGVVPGAVSAKTPTRSGTLIAVGGSFKNDATVTQSYTYVFQIIRTSTSAGPVCAITGCVTGGTVTVLKTLPGSVSASRGQTVNLATSHTCATSTVTRWYWTWLKVADTGGLVALSLSPRSLSGKFC